MPLKSFDHICGRSARIGDLIESLFKDLGHFDTLEHTGQVVQKAVELAALANVDKEAASTAAWLHDVSVCIPRESWIEVAEYFGIYLLPEERQVPLVAHQKLSAAIAANYFAIDDRRVLEAIGCHTTLRAAATNLDKVLFVADKIAWDQKGVPPYAPEITLGLRRSIDDAALAYLDYLWCRRATLPVLHPWVIDARIDLRNKRVD